MFKPERFQLEYAWIIKIRIKPLISDYIGLTGFVLCANASAHSLLQIIRDIVSDGKMVTSLQKTAGFFQVVHTCLQRACDARMVK